MIRKYDTVLTIDEMVQTPGIWIEYVRDELTGIQEQNGAKYLVPFSKDKLIDIRDGNQVNANRICLDGKQYTWMCIDNFFTIWH